MSSGKYYIQNEFIYGPKMSGKFYRTIISMAPKTVENII